MEHNGYDLDLEWDGGENPLTFKNISLSTPYEGFRLFPDKSDPDNTKNHYLVLEGENTLYCDYEDQGIKVLDGSSLYVSAKSSEGKLNITQGMIRLNNATMTIESGEVSVDYLSWDNDGCSVILSGDAKLRVRGGSYEIVKAADGYVLNTTTDGEYTVYTVTAVN